MPNKYTLIVEKLQGHYPDHASVYTPLDQVRLNEIEAQLGSALPEDYREFLRDYSGVEIHRALFPIHNARTFDQGSISGFYGPTRSHPEHSVADTYASFLHNYDPLEDMYEWYPGLSLIRETTVSETELGWPKELLPIGYDSQANHVCLALPGLRPGSIFFWINTPCEGDSNVYLVAGTFDHFMHQLEKAE